MAPLVHMMRSYASDAATVPSEKAQWLLYVRQEKSSGDDAGAFVLSAVVWGHQETDARAMYERRLDGDAIDQHIEELGVEMRAAAFSDLLLKTLAQRDCVDVEIADDAVDVLLTYKFSDSVSRRGRVGLRCVAPSLPLAVTTLLADVHSAKSHESVLTPLQKLQRLTPSQPSQKTTTRQSLPLSQESTTSASDGDALDSTTSTPAASTASASQALKRRHVPTGTARRKGPRGAKLAKID